MKKINLRSNSVIQLFSYSIILLFIIVGLSAQAQSRKAYIVKDGATLFERDITGIDSIQFVPATFFTVTYHSNGESVTLPAAQKVLNGSAVGVAALPGYDPATASKYFDGWNTKADGSGDLYTPGGALKVTQNITLYARWTVPVVTTPTGDYIVNMGPVPEGVPDLQGLEPQPGMWYGVLPPDFLDGDRIEPNTSYTISYTLKSSIPANFISMGLADVSGETGEGIRALAFLNAAESLFFLPKNMVVSGEEQRTTQAGFAGRAVNNSKPANCVSFYLFTTQSTDQPTLTISELTLRKAEPVTLVSVTANGSMTQKTTQFTFTFDKPIEGFIADHVRFDPVTYFNKIASIKGSGKIFVLDVEPTSSFLNTSYDIGVTVKIPRYAIKDYFNKVTVYNGTGTPPDPPSATLKSVTANGSTSQKTTQLTLTFSAQVTGLAAADITLIGVNGFSVTKGTLSAPVVSGKDYVYTLPVSGFTTGGKVSVAVSKTGWIIYNTTKAVTVYYDYPSITYTGFLGKGYDVLNGSYFDSYEVKSQYALDMRRIVAEGKIIVNRDEYRGTNNLYIYGETLEKYQKKFSLEAKLKGSYGLFKASASFNYDTQNSIQSQRSFGTVRNELIKEKHNINDISPAELQTEYINTNFRDQWLLNNKVSPEELFASYGTHIFLEAYLGGTMEMSYDYNNTTQESASQIKAHLEASYATVSGSVDEKIEEQSSNFRKQCDEKIKSRGGNLGYDLSSFVTAKANYTNWANSIETGTKLAFIKSGDFDNMMQIIPVWELIDLKTSAGLSERRARYNEIKDEYERILAENGSAILKLQKSTQYYVTNIYLGSHSNSSDIAYTNLLSQSTSPIYCLDGNLNTGHKHFVYLGYTDSRSANQALTDIKAVRGGGGSTLMTGTLVINGITYTQAGRKGNPDTYLYVTNDPKAGSVIKDLYVEVNGNLDGRIGNTGWSRVKYTDYYDAGMSDKATVYIWMRR